MPVLNAQALIQDRVEAIRAYHETTGIPRAEIDVSGGIDSAVMVMLLARALGPDNITAVYTGIHSSIASKVRAREVAKAAGVRLIALDLTDDVETVNDHILSGLAEAGYDMDEIIERMEKDPTVLGSFRSCLRAPVGRFLNRLTGNGIRHGTGNECEDRWLRFYQKGGDGEVDTNPIAMLSKGEVFQLARALEVPRSILEATPSHDLHEGAKTSHDEEELRNYAGVDWTYSRVDPDSGAYTRVGTIERLSRFLDHQFPAWFDSWLFVGHNGEDSISGKWEFNMGALVEQARPFFDGFTDRGVWLFVGHNGEDSISGKWEFNMGALVEQARPFFDGFTDREIRDFLDSARLIERATRHKMNPNCPTLGPGFMKEINDSGGPLRKGDREVLIEQGILTDELPKV